MENKEIYLVTGAAGNLGSSVVADLLKQGKEVRCLVLKGDPAAARLPRQAQLRVGDVTDPASLEGFFGDLPADADLYVIHCAAIVTVSDTYSQKVWDVNVQGTKNIIDQCLAHGAKRLVYVGSTSAIPELPRGQAITEVDHYDPDKVIGFYGKTKAAASQAVMDAVAQRGLDACLVFPTGIAGPDDYAFGPVAGFIVEYCQGKMPAGVAGSFNAVDVRDLAAAIVAACKKGRRGEGYILGNQLVTMAEMFHLLSRLTGTKEVKTILPEGMGRLMGHVFDVVESVTHKPQRMTSFAVYNLVRNNEFDCSKARRELGFVTRPFEETLADTIAWLRRENKIGGIAV